MEAFAPVAQWIEQRISNPLVAGSIPAGRTFSLIKPLWPNVIWLKQSVDLNSVLQRSGE